MGLMVAICSVEESALCVQSSHTGDREPSLRDVGDEVSVAGAYLAGVMVRAPALYHVGARSSRSRFLGMRNSGCQDWPYGITP